MRPKIILLVTAVPFAVNLVLYLLTLAPTVTFEDSGELIAAAYHLGVPHPPGYPIFCLVGKLFTYLPFGSVAWRVNLMSAVFTGLSTAILSWAALLLLMRIHHGRTKQRRAEVPPHAYAAAIASGILMGTAFEVWEQALIAEAYGLNGFALAMDLLLLFLWERAAAERRHRFFYGLCFTLGLGLLAHPISVIFLPVALLFIVLTDRRYLLSTRRLIWGAACFTLGLLPVVYLPLASLTNPIIDWGNPETFTNFLLVVTRGLIPYETQQISKTVGQIVYYFVLLVRQWFPVLLVPAVMGLVLLFRYSRKHFWVAGAFWLMSAPVVSIITNINVTTTQPEVLEGNRWIVSVFYIPSYMCLSLTAGIGLWYIGRGIARLVKNEAAGALSILLLPVVFIPLSYGRVDMSHYLFAQAYAGNVFRVADRDALIITEADPEFFPLVYYQAVEGERTDLVVINRHHLTRSWYIQYLKDHQPKLVAASARAVEEFLKALEPFEKKRPYNGLDIQNKYESLIRSFIQKTIEDGRSVYLSFVPTCRITAGYETESLGVVLRLSHGSGQLSSLDPEELRFGDYSDPSAMIDFPARFMMRRFRSLLAMRGRQLEAAGDKSGAARFYRLASGLGD